MSITPNNVGTLWGIVKRVKKFIDLTNREIVLNAERKQLEAEKQELHILRDRDKAISQSLTHGISVTSTETVYGYWYGESQLKVRIPFQIRNEWTKPVMFDRLTGQIYIGQGNSNPLPNYMDKATVGPFNTAPISVVYDWSLTAEEMNQYFPHPECLSLLEMQVRSRAYFIREGTDFYIDLPQSRLSIIVYPRNTPKPLYGV